MYLYLMEEKEKNVKVGDRVNVHGWTGTVIDVSITKDVEWTGSEYKEVPGSDSLNIRVHFDEPKKIGYQYEGGWYGGFAVIDK